jgi:hypothetical protein
MGGRLFSWVSYGLQRGHLPLVQPSKMPVEVFSTFPRARVVPACQRARVGRSRFLDLDPPPRYPRVWTRKKPRSNGLHLIASSIM